MSARNLVRLARAVAPAAVRDRMAEEWQADLEGAEEVGLSARSVARGALRTAAGARAALLIAAGLAAVAAAADVLLGIVVGAICAIGDVSVLEVFLIVALARVALSVVARSRQRSAARRVGVRQAVLSDD